MDQYKVCIISFLRNDELKPQSFDILNKKLANHYTVIPVIISESELNDLGSDVMNIVIPNSTKYRRIKIAFNFVDTDYYFCMDSDIILDIDKTLSLIRHTIEKDLDISWGRIGVSRTGNLIEKLIDIDKILSHSIIRPTLWKLNIGITIPGQTFLFKKESLIQAFNFRNTFLDDLAVGTYVRKNIRSLKISPTKNTIGFEAPSKTFAELLDQRKRWANGYRSMILDTKNTSSFKYVLIHGFSYHFLWIFLFGLFGLALWLNIYIFALTLIPTIFFLSGKSLPKFFYSIIYLAIFPFFHIWWFYCFLEKDA
ncbi:glycosyltransferase family 2 protein [Salegentibacter sp. LM13S]|uniref:glycosyltransferase n=1 Tax=Salegentibacter lacus TaxID=2873599 RepID=UPI001CCDF69C|nr:glycosyltransferase family 2 protein [Salegentibacter lacus]MBZ9631257.1 glycosyltransferase family 2 protein [Salegentibacter lacus]